MHKKKKGVVGRRRTLWGFRRRASSMTKAARVQDHLIPAPRPLHLLLSPSPPTLSLFLLLHEAIRISCFFLRCARGTRGTTHGGGSCALPSKENHGSNNSMYFTPFGGNGPTEEGPLKQG